MMNWWKSLLTISLALGTSYPNASVVLGVEDEASKHEPPITNYDRDHWSFQPLLRPEMPLTDDTWCRNPIDQFIRQRQLKKELNPSPEADRVTLIRRACCESRRGHQRIRIDGAGSR